MIPPVGVEVRRGGRIESRHRISLAVARPDGSALLEVGPTAEPVYPRSAVKPFQALPLVASGAADRFGLGPRELALACASHSGEEAHVAAVAAWLRRLGLGADDLACGPHPPLSVEASRRLFARGEEPTRLHNNCSGKHTAMLTVAVHLGLSVHGYERPDHPVQRRIREVLGRLAESAVLDPPGTDGCGVPSWPAPLRAWAVAAARFATGEGLAAGEAEAARKLIAACRAEPYFVAGTGRACTRVIAALADGMVKTGAEGVFLGFFPRAGLGLALKAEDGGTRASETALLAALGALGLLGARAEHDLADLLERPVTNTRGERVGEIVPAPGFPPAAEGS